MTSEDEEIEALLRGASEKHRSILDQQQRDNILGHKRREIVVPEERTPAEKAQSLIKRRRLIAGSSTVAKPAARALSSTKTAKLSKSQATNEQIFSWKSAWFALAGALGAAVIAGACAVGAQVIDTMNPPAPTSETRTVCASAYENVKAVLDLGVNSPDLLEKVNPQEVDAQCGNEDAIAEDMQSGP